MLSNVTTNFDSVMAQCESYDEEMVQVCIRTEDPTCTAERN